jgi:hypothetical protein
MEIAGLKLLKLTVYLLEKMTIINDDEYGDINDILANKIQQKSRKTDSSKFEVEKEYVGPHLLPPAFVDQKFVEVSE